jgi:hypothetical protein
MGDRTSARARHYAGEGMADRTRDTSPRVPSSSRAAPLTSALRPPPSAQDIDRSVISGTFAGSLCGTDARRTRCTLWHLSGATSEPFDAFLGLRYRRHSFVASTHCGGLPSRVGRNVSRNLVGVDFAYHRRKPRLSSIRPRSMASSIARLIRRRGICHHRASWLYGMSRLPFSVPAWLMFSTSSALMNRRQLIDASRNARDRSISRLYQHQGSPAGGPPILRLFIAARRQAIARRLTSVVSR